MHTEASAFLNYVKNSLPNYFMNKKSFGCWRW